MKKSNLHNLGDLYVPTKLVEDILAEGDRAQKEKDRIAREKWISDTVSECQKILRDRYYQDFHDRTHGVCQHLIRKGYSRVSTKPALTLEEVGHLISDIFLGDGEAYEVFT